MRPDEVWEGKRLADRAIRVLLTPASWLYAFGWQAYLAMYKVGIKKAAEPHFPVICVGNLLVGGSGKSPLTMHIADVLQRMGKSVVIGCSGYGAPHSKDASIAPNGPLHASEWGDEPAMFRWLRPEVPLVVGRDRVMAASLVHQQFPDAVLLMDDGFQHLPLKKHLTIIIDEGLQRNHACLPAGPYREPRRNRFRATKVIPDDFQIVRSQLRIVSPTGNPVIPEKFAILCALGQPEKFLAALRAQFPNQASEDHILLLNDHDPLTDADLWKSLPRELSIIVTAKDWVKLKDRPDVADRNFLIARQEVSLEPNEEFQIWVERNINE